MLKLKRFELLGTNALSTRVLFTPPWPAFTAKFSSGKEKSPYVGPLAFFGGTHCRLVNEFGNS